jgi:orotidine 5'-phosphate decarboxylase subfamily 1
LKGLQEGAQSVGQPRGVLLIAEMSSSHHLASGTYTIETFKMAQTHREFVTGFICQKRYDYGKDPNADGFIYMTPGVNLSQIRDSLGQQYNHPEAVILNQWCDVIIVGRGILQDQDPVKAAERYRNIAWKAYVKRCAHINYGN